MGLEKAQENGWEPTASPAVEVISELSNEAVRHPGTVRVACRDQIPVVNVVQRGLGRARIVERYKSARQLANEAMDHAVRVIVAADNDTRRIDATAESIATAAL